MRIGVLALLGDFGLHAAALRRVAAEPVEIRKPGALDDVDGLILPGGESTTLLHLMDAWDFAPAIRSFHESLLAREVEGPRQPSLGLIDVTVERNSYGRQRESFDAEASVDLGEGSEPLRMVFIRAPRILRAGPGVEVLARQSGDPVLAREGSVLVASFHPELSGDLAVHRYFCRMAEVRAIAG